MPKRLKLLASQDGQSILEVALLTPFLLLLLVGIIDMGRFAYIGILMGNAARAGAAYASQSTGQSVDYAGIANAVQDDFGSGISPVDASGNATQLTVTPSGSPTTSCGCDSGSGQLPSGLPQDGSTCTDTGATSCKAGNGNWAVMVTVTASGKFKPIFPGFFSKMTITRACTMRVTVPMGT